MGGQVWNVIREKIPSPVLAEAEAFVIWAGGEGHSGLRDRLSGGVWSLGTTGGPKGGPRWSPPTLGAEGHLPFCCFPRASRAADLQGNHLQLFGVPPSFRRPGHTLTVSITSWPSVCPHPEVTTGQNFPMHAQSAVGYRYPLGLAPRPLQILKSEDAQVPYRKWYLGYTLHTFAHIFQYIFYIVS